MQSIGQERENNFNLLRITFAVLVLLSHAPELVDGNRKREIFSRAFHTMSLGEVAVAGFFLLSGYLIVQSWISSPSILGFLKKRILRIYPAFIVSSLISVFFVGPLASESANYFSAFWLNGFLKELFFLEAPTTPAVFSGTPYPVVNGSMWTISYEFKCYLAVLIFGIMGLFKRHHFWIIVTAGVLAALLMQKLGFLVMRDTFALRLASYFLCGGCFFLYKHRLNFNKKIAAVMGILLIIGLFFDYSAELAFATAGAYLLFYFALTPVENLKTVNRYPDVSYGVYLYGWPVQKLLLWYFPDMSPWVLFVLSTFFCIVLGAISWFIVEKPALKLKSINLRMMMRSAMPPKA